MLKEADAAELGDETDAPLPLTDDDRDGEGDALTALLLRDRVVEAEKLREAVDDNDGLRDADDVSDALREGDEERDTGDAVFDALIDTDGDGEALP